MKFSFLHWTHFPDDIYKNISTKLMIPSITSNNPTPIARRHDFSVKSERLMNKTTLQALLEHDKILFTVGEKKILWNLKEFTLTRSLWKRDVWDIRVVWF